MQKLLPTTLLLFFVTIFSFNSTGQSGVYVGGPMYYSRDVVVNELKTSGFTNVTVWTIHIMENGDLNFNAEFPLVSNGVYIGHEKYPQFTSDVAALKQAPTTIKRIEFGLSAWGSSTYDNIKKLVNEQGTDTSSILYKNFYALKQAFPNVDALNNDDEGTYDLASTTAFSIMLADIGFKNTWCPYTNKEYWANLTDSIQKYRPESLDAVYLQCYSGGAGNNPCNWEDAFNGVTVWPGIWSHNATFITNAMTLWQSECNTNGGWLWLYDEFYGDIDVVRKAASALNLVFGIEYSDTVPSPATNPSPVSSTAECSLLPNLSWSMGFGATQHHVYLGSSENLDTTNYIGTVTSNNLVITEALQGNEIYYWRVDEANAKGTTQSEVWNFSTIEYEIQAENYSSWFGCKIDSTEPGYTGIGYVDFGGKGSYIEFENFEVGSKAEVTLLIYYANGNSAAPRECDVYLNHNLVTSIDFTPTSNWKDWQVYEQDLTLNSNYNILRFEQTTSGGPNIDRIGIRINNRLTNAELSTNNTTEFSAYPSIANNEIVFNGLDQNESYIIYNSNGSAVVKSENEKLDISKLKAGLYIVISRNHKKTEFIKL